MLDRASRNREFQSTSLQRRVRELSVPERLPARSGSDRTKIRIGRQQYERHFATAEAGHDFAAGFGLISSLARPGGNLTGVIIGAR
jgi:hypothetical protein